MEKSLSHLPKHKRNELNLIVSLAPIRRKPGLNRCWENRIDRLAVAGAVAAKRKATAGRKAGIRQTEDLLFAIGRNGRWPWPYPAHLLKSAVKLP